MKFTSEDLMNAMGLAVGDRVKVTLVSGKLKIYEVVKSTDSLNEEKVCLTENKSLSYLLNIDFEILPRPKTVGDLKCGQFNTCETCPLQFICNLYVCSFNEDNSLYNILTKIDVYDQEIYDLLKNRLDKEVVEE